MGNLAEMFISFVLASGQWAAPIQRGFALDANASGPPGDGAISSIPPEPEPRLARSVQVLFPPQLASGSSPALRTATDGPTEGQESVFDRCPQPISLTAKSLGLSPGDRVRFSAAEEQPTTEGYVVAADPEALQLRVPGVDAPVRIPRSSLRWLEAYQGQHSFAGRGAKIGAVSVGIPLAAGTFLAATFPRRRCNGWPECSAVSLVGGAVGAGIGSGVGALIGKLVKIERWDQRIPSSAESIGLSPGDRVRFSTAGDTPLSEGYVVAADQETLLLTLSGVDEPVRISRSSLRRLKVHRGRHSSAGRGAMIGALSAGIPWAVVGGFYSWLLGPGWVDFVVHPRGWAGAVVGAGAGVLIGALVKTERWDKVDFPRIRVGVSPQRGGGLAVALSMRF